VKRKPYSFSDLEYLCKCYGAVPIHDLAAQMERTSASLMTTVRKLIKNGQFQHFRKSNRYFPDITAPDIKINHYKKGPQSGVRGVVWQNNRWVARIREDKKMIYLGYFDEVEEAQRAIEHFKATGERYYSQEKHNEGA
jgi:hypothetical protein